LDVNKSRMPYNKLEFLTAYKVGSSPELSMYLQEKERLQQKRAGPELWVDTCRNDVQQKARDHSLTGENEYLLLRGVKAKRLKEKMCQAKTKPANKDPYNSNYGFGFYLSDASDKIDQYTGESVAGDKLSHIKTMLGFLPSTEIEQELEALADSADDVLFAAVVRTYLGKHIEVQIDYQSCYRNQPDEERQRMWYYRDTYTGQSVTIPDQVGGSTQFNKEPPFEDWDSVKVMSTTMNPEYSEDIRPGVLLSPGRHNEYIARRREQFAIQYIVAYARKWDEDDPSGPVPCRCHRKDPKVPCRCHPADPRVAIDGMCPWAKPGRPSCTPCTDGWKYDGPRGRNPDGWKNDGVQPTCNGTG